MGRTLSNIGATPFMAAAILLVAALQAPAHHAFASEYDAKRRVIVSGTVTRFEWTNPHAWLYVDGSDGNGAVTEWSFEMGSPGGLTRRGWNRAALKTGDHIAVEGFAAKDGSHRSNAGNVTLPDGRKLFGGFQSTPGAPPK